MSLCRSTIDYNEFVEGMRTVFCCAQRGRTGVLTLLGAVVADLKHADEQEGGFGSHAPAPAPASPPSAAAAPAAPAFQPSGRSGASILGKPQRQY